MNTQVKCLIVDDEPLALTLMQAHIKQVPQLELVGSCQNALEAFALLRQEAVDLVFLDIQMPVLTGIELVKSLPQRPAIIFTTAHRQYAVESYELNVVDYLLKPIPFTRFFKAVNKYLDSHAPSLAPAGSAVVSEPNSSLFVNVNKKQIRVELPEILYIESLKDYLRIVTKTQRLVTKQTLSAFLKRLPAQFCRVHRSYVVNLQQLTAYTQQDIEIGEIEIPIGPSYKQAFLQQMS